MLKYASHTVYCVLLCVLLFRLEAGRTPPPPPPPTELSWWAKLPTHVQAGDSVHLGYDAFMLLWFLRLFVAWNVTWFCAAVYLDVCGVRYSHLGDTTIRASELMPIVLYSLALTMNIGACTMAMGAYRVVFSFSLSVEIAASVLLLFAYQTANVRYNMDSFARLEPFWIGKGLDLRKHQRWSLALSNLGLTCRLFKRVLLFLLSVMVWPTVPTLAELCPTWRYPTTWAVLAHLLLTPLSLGFTFFQYHLVHAWLHASPTLYRTVHKIHHLARYPIPSDSGTISPLEFALHEITLPKVLTPFWFWLPGEVFIGIQHRKDHTFELGNEELREGKVDGSAWHMLHHSKNVGNYSFQPLDKLFGTAIRDITSIAPFALG